MLHPGLLQLPLALLPHPFQLRLHAPLQPLLVLPQLLELLEFLGDAGGGAQRVVQPELVQDTELVLRTRTSMS